MADMKTAIQKAGITIPGNQRIWLWLKDHPKSTGAQISAVLKLADNNVATLCKDMCDRGMMTREFEQRRGKAGKGWTLRDVALYTVNPKMETYELWPKKKKAPQKPPLQKAAPAAVPTPANESVALPTWSPEVFVQPLNLPQARDLYRYLDSIFNPKEK